MIVTLAWPRADASAAKVFGTEFAVEAYRLLMEVLGAAGVVRSGSAGEVLAGRDSPWADLAAAGVLAAGLPAALDGAGLGLLVLPSTPGFASRRSS
jgi:alkylation response protein AidB-like acyl-CoA dehydrogenase